MEQSSQLIAPLLSVVIPTRNRVPYAIWAIRQVLNTNDSRLELVVQDNSDTMELSEWIDANVFDNRLVYNYVEKPLSFIHNFDVAAQRATGEYTCFIGDDDGINPEIMGAAQWAATEDLDALVIRPRINYVWPASGMPSTLFTKVTSGFLLVRPFQCIIQDVAVEAEVEILLKNGGLYYLDRDLPKLYHGLVHRRCLDRIRERTGAYFGGLSPDTYASLAVACVAKRVASTSYPLTIPGACRASGSMQEGQIKKHSRRLEDAPHFRNRGEYEWCELVPRVYTVETIWADSSMAALRAMGYGGLVGRLNLPKLAAHCIGSNRGVARKVLSDFFSTQQKRGQSRLVGSISLLWGLITGPGSKFAARAWNRLLLTAGARTVDRFTGVDNIVEASEFLGQYLKESGRSFGQCIPRRGSGR